MQTKTHTDPNLRNLEFLSKLMDSQFRFPGTNIRFGLDALVGLIPGLGDLSTFTVSGLLIMMMAKNGASGFVLSKMVMNVLIDSIIGSIPVIGDIFDVAFRANQKNLNLLKEHYQEGRHRGSAWKLIIPVLIILLALIALIVWGGISLAKWLIDQLS